MIAFLDANALIYLIEGKEPFARHVRAQLQQLEDSAPRLQLSMSRLSWLECSIGPLKAQNAQILADYDSFFSQPDLICVELNANVVELATIIRARHGLKTPDALQAASCMQLGQEHLFVTADKQFNRIPGLKTSLVG